MPKGISKDKAALQAAQQTTVVPKGAKVFPGTDEPLPEGVTVRSGKGVQIDFMYEGVRHTETVGGKPTVAHVLAAAAKRERVLSLIGYGTFDYAKEFPESTSARKMEEEADLPQKTIGALLDEWLAHKTGTVGPNAYKDYEKDSRYLKSQPLYMFEALDTPVKRRRGGFLEELPAHSLADTHIVYFRGWLLAKKLSIKRINNVLTPLRGAMERLHKDAIHRNPFNGVRPLVEAKPNEQVEVDTNYDLDAPLPIEAVAQFVGDKRKPDPFASHECEAILEQLSGPFYNQILFWRWTGLRTGELIALRWSDIDLERKRMYIRRSVSRGKLTFPKFRRERWVDLPPPAIAALMAQFVHTGQQRAWVFMNPWTGARWANESKIRTRFIKACTLASVRYRRPYHFRHTYASTLLSAGENPLYVAEQMGHADWTMISRVYGRWMRPVDQKVGQRLAGMHQEEWQVLLQKLATRQASLPDLTSEEDDADEGDTTEVSPDDDA